MELAITRTEKNLKRVGGVLGIIQGASWLIMSLICIIFYNEGVQQLDINSYMDEVNALMYTFFLSRSTNNTIAGQITTPKVFTHFMWAYLVLDLFWILVSFNVINKTKRKVRTALKLWNLVTSLISLLDLAFVVLLGMDYYHCLDDWFIYFAMDSMEMEAFCANGILPVLIIVAKGFILWFVNVIFIIIFAKMTRRLKDKSPVQIIAPFNQHNCRCSSAPSIPAFPIEQNLDEFSKRHSQVRASYEYQSVIFAPSVQHR